MPKDEDQMMEIEVTFGSRSDYVIVHYTDDPYELAKAFVKKHKLRESSLNPIYKYIVATIEDFLASSPVKERRNSSHDSADSSFDYDNVPMRYHNPIVEVEQPKPKDKSNADHSRNNSNNGDKHSHSHEHHNNDHSKSKEKINHDRDRTSNHEKHHNDHHPQNQNSGTQNGHQKTPIPTKQNSTSSAVGSSHSPIGSHDSDIVRLAKESLNANSADSPMKPADRQRQNSNSSTISSVGGTHSQGHSTVATAPTVSATTTPPVDGTANHLRTSPLRIRGSDSEFFLETKGQSLPEPTPTAAVTHVINNNNSHTIHTHNSSTHNVHSTGHHHHHNTSQHHNNNASLHSLNHINSSHSPDNKRIQYSADDLEFLSSLEDPNAVDHKQFQANLDRNMNSSLSNFSYRKIATELVSASRTPSVTSEHSHNSRASGRRHFGDGRKRLDDKKNGIAELTNSDYLNTSDPGYDMDGEFEPNRSGASDDFEIGLERSDKRTHSKVSLSLDAGVSAKKKHDGPSVPKREASMFVGKSANERLYMTADILKKKQVYRQEQAEKKLKEEMAAKKFKLNEASKKIVQRLSVKSYPTHDDGDNHIGVRLYTEGVREKQMKIRRSDNMRGITVCEEWSCSKCGTFHKITTANVVIQPLAQVESRGSSNGNNASQLQNKVVKICSNCKWDQGAVESFKPVNIGLKLHENSEDVVSTRRHAVGGTIHDQLYKDAKENGKQLRDQAKYEDDVVQSMCSFNPQIPESSKAIINSHMSGANSSHNYGESFSSTRNTNGTKKAVIVGSQLGEYFSIPVVERLTQTKTRIVDEFHTLYKQPPPATSSSRSNSRSRTRGVDESQVTAAPTKTDKFFDRLVYEYKDKDEKLKDLTEKWNKDPVTGQPLYQPVVPELPADIYHVNPSSSLAATNASATTTTSQGKRTQQKAFVDNILQRDQELKLKKLAAQEKAIKRELEILRETKAKALEHSDMILRAATDRNIDDLFHLLTMQHVVADENKSGNVMEDSEDAWRKKEVDLLWVNKDVMIEEVSRLIVDIRNQKLEQLQQSSKSDLLHTQKLLVNFEEFKKLALRCMKRRDGTGKAYIYAPKKKPEVALQMIKEGQKEETFKPTLGKISQELSQSRTKRLHEEPIELILQAEGDKLKNKVEEARRERILQQSTEFTFKPTLHKTPAYIQPRYKGIDNTTSEMDEAVDSDHESSRGSRGNVIDAKTFLNNNTQTNNASTMPPPLPSEIQVQPVKPKPATEPIRIGGVKGKSKSKHLQPSVFLKSSSDEMFNEELSVSTAGLSSSPFTEPRSLNMSVSASSYSNSYTPRVHQQPPPPLAASNAGVSIAVKKSSNNNSSTNSSTSGAPATTNTAATTSTRVSATKALKKSVAKDLPLLPFEALANKVNSTSDNYDGKRSSSGSMTIAELRRAPTNRLSVDSALTHSTSSTLVKKK